MTAWEMSIMLEQYGLYFLLAGLVLGVIGWIWLVVAAFKVGFLWGLCGLIPPLGLLFIARHYRRARGPFFVLLLAALVFATPFGMNFYAQHFIKLGPHERVVDGELRITLTGLKDFDYSKIEARRDAAVLQMANEDVNDETLEYLKGMDRLYSLDLNGTRVTDKGLAIVASLPRLRELRLARTKITDEGFKKYLASKESLLKLDLTGTDVKGKTKRDWKKEKPRERDFVD
jgi:Leucine Rich repeat